MSTGAVAVHSRQVSCLFEDTQPRHVPPNRLARGAVDEVDQLFSTGNQRVVLLCQPNGVYCKTGKTTVAQQYVDLEKFSKVLWVDGEKLAVDPKLVDEMTQTDGWLCVFDGVESERQLRDAGYHLDVLSQHGHILITTRSSRWPSQYKQLPIDVFSLSVAKAHLQTNLPDCKEDIAQRIALALGCVPSSLQKAITFMRERGILPENYLAVRQDELVERAKELSQKGYLPERNETFVGREADLVGLEEELSTSKPLVLAAEVGLGGIGKTQLALQYAYRNLHQYQTVFWINAENEATLMQSYQNLARFLKIPNTANLIQVVNGHLQTHPGWLLIYDDASDPKALEKVLPTSGGQVIITSRNIDWGKIAQVFKVNVFKPDESLKLMMEITGLYGQEEEAKRLCEEDLHHLPLAVAQAASYIRETGVSIAVYRKKFHEIRQVLWKHERPPANLYEKTVVETWNVTMDILVQRLPFAREVMRFCSFFAARNIPRGELLERWAHFRGEANLDAALASLRKYSMIDLTTEFVGLHPLVQTVVGDAIPVESRRGELLGICDFMRNYQKDHKQPPFCWWESNPANIRKLFLLRSHGFVIADRLIQMGCKAEAIDFLVTIGTFSYHQNNFSLAEIALQRALGLEEREGIHFNLGHVYLAIDDLDRAEHHYSKTKGVSGLIQVHLKRGRFEEAKRLIEPTIQKFEDGPPIRGTTDVRYFLGFLHKDLARAHLGLKNPKQAIPCLLQAKEDFEGIKHFTSAAEVDLMLANIYESSGANDLQRKHLEFAVAVLEKTVDHDLPDSIRESLIDAFRKLFLLSRSDRPEQAVIYLSKAIALAKSKYGQYAKETLSLKGLQ